MNRLGVYPNSGGGAAAQDVRIDENAMGQFVGSSDTIAGFAAADAVGDWAALTVDIIGTGTEDSPQFPAGGYVWDGTEYVFSFSLSGGVSPRVSKVERYQINQEELTGGPTTNGAGGGTGPQSLSLGQIIIPAAGVYPVTHSTTGLVNNAGMGISSAPFPDNNAPAVAGGDIFTSASDRLSVAEPSKTYPVDFPAAGTYYVGVFSGGGARADSHTVTVEGIGATAGAGPKVQVFTYEGDTQPSAAFLESDNSELDISGGIPTGWELCEPEFNCISETILTPASDWTVSGGIAGTTSFSIGSAGQQDGVAEYAYSVPVGRRGTKHAFGFELGAVTAGGNDIALRVEVEQGGEILESQDLLTDETVQAIELEFFPTADVIIRIRDTSTGTQGSNRDAVVRDMQLVATCEGRSLSVDKTTTTAIFDGVFVDAAPAWTDGLVMADNQTRTLETGLNLLTDVDHIWVSYARNVNADGANLWPSPAVKIRIKDILLDITQGMLINHFDNQFLSVTTTTEAELIAGNINFRAESQNGTFGYEITRVEFRKRAVGSSPLIGFKFEGPPNLESTIQGVLEIRDRTVTNGAVDNPIFAARWPSLVSGNDIVIPSNFEGAFSRNLGGNAAAFETFQGHAQALIPNAPTATQVNGGGGNTVRGRTAGPETRPDNFGMQWYFIMDDYVDLNNSVSTPTPKVTAPAVQNYVDIGTMRLQWGVIDHLDSADGGTVTLPVPFADDNYVVQYTLSESTSIDGPAASVGVNVWTENLTPTQFGHNRDNDIDFAHIHWLAIGRKAAALDAGPQLSNLSSGQIVSDFTQDNNGNLQVNLRNTTAVALFWEIYVQNVPYSTVAEDAGVYAVRTRDNGDGTYSHVLAGVAPLNGFANLTVGPAAIDVSGNGNPDIDFYFEVDASSI